MSAGEATAHPDEMSTRNKTRKQGGSRAVGRRRRAREGGTATVGVFRALGSANIRQELADLDSCLPEPILKAITEFRPRRHGHGEQKEDDAFSAAGFIWGPLLGGLIMISS